MAKDKLFLFWDNSNIYIPAQDIAMSRDPFQSRYAVRIYFEHLMDLVRCGRSIERGVVVGSVPPELNNLLSRLENSARVTPLRVISLERGNSSGTEQGVDQTLQLSMLRVLCDYPPSVVALLTGDGSGHDEGEGFLADLQRMYRKGWGIELYSWQLSCNRKLREWAESVGAFIPLEDYYDSITFIEGGRRGKPISRRKHAIARPRVVRKVAAATAGVSAAAAPAVSPSAESIDAA